MTHSRKSTLFATLAALCGNAIFGFSFMFSRLALNVASPFVMLMYRFMGAFIVLNGVALWARRQRRQDWLRFCVPWRQSAPLFALGLVQPVLYFLCESYGISLTNATVSGVIIALVPIVALGAGALFLHEKPSLRQVAFSLLSIAGVVVMTLQQSAGGTIRPVGVILLIGAVLSGVGFNILSRRLSQRFSALERTYVMMGVGFVCFTLFALWETGADLSLLAAPLKSRTFLTSMIYLSVFSSILAFLFLNYASTELPVSKTTAFCNLTTVLSVFAGVVFLDETVNALSLVAAAVIILGVLGVQRG